MIDNTPILNLTLEYIFMVTQRAIITTIVQRSSIADNELNTINGTNATTTGSRIDILKDKVAILDNPYGLTNDSFEFAKEETKLSNIWDTVYENVRKSCKQHVEATSKFKLFDNSVVNLLSSPLEQAERSISLNETVVWNTLPNFARYSRNTRSYTMLGIRTKLSWKAGKDLLDNISNDFAKYVETQLQTQVETQMVTQASFLLFNPIYDGMDVNDNEEIIKTHSDKCLKTICNEITQQLQQHGVKAYVNVEIQDVDARGSNQSRWKTISDCNFEV